VDPASKSLACPRCAGPALLSVQVSPGSNAVLCSACDLDDPTGGPVVLWFAVNGSLKTPGDVEELESLLRPWINSYDVRSCAAVAGSGGLICDFCEDAVPRWAYEAGWFACDSCRPRADAQHSDARPWPSRSPVYRWP
jgi:hypothetical protein